MGDYPMADARLPASAASLEPDPPSSTPSAASGGAPEALRGKERVQPQMSHGGWLACVGHDVASGGAPEALRAKGRVKPHMSRGGWLACVDHEGCFTRSAQHPDMFSRCESSALWQCGA